jgi:hypothetical protein
MNSIPQSILVSSFIFVVIPFFIAVYLRWFCYQYLRGLNQDLSRSVSVNGTIISKRLSGVIKKLRDRYMEVSLKTDRVNTMALVEVVYSEQSLRCFPLISISLDRIDSFTRSLPSLLLFFGLIMTFLGITDNLRHLSDVISKPDLGDINQLLKELQPSLDGMGKAFWGSLIALFFSAVLIIINLFINITTEKYKLISNFEDYLDNIYQTSLNGDSKLDKTIADAASKFDAFLTSFSDSIKSAVESALNDKIQRISSAYNKVSEKALQTYSHLDDAASKISQGANQINSSSLILCQAVKEINDSKFAQSLSATTSAMGHNVREFEISSQRLSKTVESTEKLFAASGVSFSEAINKLVNTQDGFVLEFRLTKKEEGSQG